MKLIVLLLVALLIVGAFFYFERQRSNALSKVAQGMGFRFTPGQQTLPPELDRKGFYLFAQGSRQIVNLMQGERRGRQIAVFGYFYDAGVGMEGQRELPNSNDDGEIQRRAQTVVWIHDDDLHLPDFDLTPAQGAIRRVAQEQQFQRITFDGDSRFNSDYILTGRNAETLRGLFGAEVRRFIEAEGPFTVEGRGQDLLLYRTQDRAAPQEIPTLVQRAEQLAALLQQRPS